MLTCDMKEKIAKPEVKLNTNWYQLLLPEDERNYAIVVDDNIMVEGFRSSIEVAKKIYDLKEK